uniref:Uncharacterized protein n=1 Tax=Dulem virus 33 TaxID=3145751 RepID=A0AAU8B6A7_9CAUD
MGQMYVIDHCMTALQSDKREEAYRIYVTDCLRLIAKNTAPMAHGEYIGKRFADIINPKPEETRTADEIIDHIKKKLAQA